MGITKNCKLENEGAFLKVGGILELPSGTVNEM